MKKLLTVVLAISVVLFCGVAFAGWNAGALSGGYVSGNAAPQGGFQPFSGDTYGGIKAWGNTNVGPGTLAGSGIVAGGSGSFTEPYKYGGVTSTGGTWTQSGGITVNTTPSSTSVRVWSSSSVFGGNGGIATSSAGARVTAPFPHPER